jgi:hypothetical protein
MTEKPQLIPRRPEGPAGSPGRRKHGLEYTFGFQNEAFSEYLFSPTNITKLKDMMPVLAAADHPIVQDAAGSAAMDYALTSQDFGSTPQESLKERMYCLGEARVHWLRAMESFPALIRQDHDHKRKMDLSLMQLKMVHRLAYLPVMGTVAARYARQPLPPDEVTDRRQRTISNLVHVAKTVLAIPNHEDLQGRYRHGLLGEMACGAAGLLDENAKYTLLPCSLGRTHRWYEPARATLTASANDVPFDKTMIRIRSRLFRGKIMDEKRVLFDVANDLALGVDRRIDQTVESFVDIASGDGTPSLERSFAAIGQRVTARLDLFAVEREQRRQLLNSPATDL